MVTRQAFYDQVWDGAIVTDHALTRCVSELRSALGDETSSLRFIETVPKRGYRLVTPVEPVEDYETASIPAHRVARAEVETAGAVEPHWLHAPGLRLALVALAGALAVAAGPWSSTPS